jgi:hypothetical protein
VISSSQGLYLYTNTEKRTPNIHALSEIRTHDPGFLASEDSTCLRPLGYRDRLIGLLSYVYFLKRKIGYIYIPFKLLNQLTDFHEM